MKNYMKKTDKVPPKKMQMPEHESKGVKDSAAEDGAETMPMKMNEMPVGKKKGC